MGNYVSQNALYLAAKRVIIRFNVDNRMLRELDRQAIKPVAAPKFDAGFIDYKKLMKGKQTQPSSDWHTQRITFPTESPEYLEKTTKRDSVLDNRLKDVHVTSTEPPANEKALSRNNPNRPLPLNRHTDFFEIGYKESKAVPPGKVSLIQAMKFITDHKNSPAEYTITRIAEENKIKLDVAG